MSHLSFEDCILIEYLNKDGLSSRKIWAKINKSHVCITQELRKYSIKWVYDAKIAWWLRQKARSKANKNNAKITRFDGIWEDISQRLSQFHSPEQTSYRLKLEQKKTVSTSTIYRYIYQYHPECIKKYLRRWWKKYRKSWVMKYQIDWRVMIDDRPKEVNERIVIGNWEWDCIVWKAHKWWALTNVERVSWFTIAKKLNNICASEVVEQTVKWFQNLPEIIKNSITYDNGREFTEHTMIQFYTGMKVYFAHPYSPWERWTNENTNWLLRQFIPKWMSFEKITQEQIDRYCDLLNNRPRKRLWRLSPREYLSVNFWLKM